MEEIRIEINGIEASEKLRRHIVQRFHSVFGHKQYMLRKVAIKLFHEGGDQDGPSICCRVQADVKSQPVVITELRSSNVITAIDLAIEHADLKLSHRINGNKEIHRRIQQKRHKLLYS